MPQNETTATPETDGGSAPADRFSFEGPARRCLLQVFGALFFLAHAGSAFAPDITVTTLASRTDPLAARSSKYQYEMSKFLDVTSSAVSRRRAGFVGSKLTTDSVKHYDLLIDAVEGFGPALINNPGGPITTAGVSTPSTFQ